MDENSASVLINMESMIKNLISSFDRLRDELEKHQGMLDDIFNNDSTYQEHSQQVKEAAKIKSATKRQILKQPQAADLNNKIKSLKSQIKESKEGLSDYLGEYQKMSGISEIEDEDGEIMEIIYVPKLVKKSSRF